MYQFNSNDRAWRRVAVLYVRCYYDACVFGQWRHELSECDVWAADRHWQLHVARSAVHSRWTMSTTLRTFVVPLRRQYTTLLLSRRRKATDLRDSDVLPFARLSHMKRVLVGHWPDWPSSAAVLGAVSGRSTAGPVKPVPMYWWWLGLIVSAIRAALTCDYYYYYYYHHRTPCANS